MEYSISQYFCKGIEKEEGFFMGICAFLESLGASFRKKEMDYSKVSDLVSYYNKSVDCEKTTDNLREYFLKNPSNYNINVFCIDKSLRVDSSEYGRLFLIARSDGLRHVGNVLVEGNLLFNSKSYLSPDSALIAGMHEAAHLFKMWHCENEELCFLKKMPSYASCNNYYLKNHDLPMCESHLSDFLKLKKGFSKNLY